MLAQENRLKKVRDFNLILKYGFWQRGRLLDLKYLELAKKQDYFPKKVDKIEFSSQLKIAFSVGLKISKSAVKRNRIKRQLSEIIRLLIKDGRIKTGFFLMFVAKKEILDKSYGEIDGEAGGLLKKAGVLL